MRTLHLLLVAALGLMLSAQAAGSPPTRVEEDIDRTRTIPAGDLCTFDVVVHSEGRSRTTTYTNPDGSLDRFTIHLAHWKTSITNPANDARSARSSPARSSWSCARTAPRLCGFPATTGTSSSRARALSIQTTGCSSTSPQMS